jgi:hypothetical protein
VKHVLRSASVQSYLLLVAHAPLLPIRKVCSLRRKIAIWAVDRLIYAAKNFPEIGWLEILPKGEREAVRERTSFMKASNERSSEFEPGEYPPGFPSDVKGPKEAARAEIGCLSLALNLPIAGWSQPKIFT